MDFKPECISTCIGSMPHADPAKALELILAHMTDIPFWPQLPSRSFLENMYAQYAYDMPGAVIDEKNKRMYIDTRTADPASIEEFLMRIVEGDSSQFPLKEEFSSGFFAFMDAKEKLGSPVAVKGHTTGPISMCLQVTDENKKAILYDDTFRELAIKQLALRCAWQDEKLREISPTVIHFLDEPYMVMFGSAYLNLKREEAISYLNEVFAGIKGLKGIHCCGNTDWPLLLDTDVQVLNLDAYNFGETLALYASNVEEYLDRGGIIAWGIVPTNEDEISKETSESILARFEKTYGKLVEKGISKEKILGQALITPSCGTGTLPIEYCEKVLKTTKEVSDRLRKEQGFTD